MRVDIGSIAIWNGNEDAITSPDYVVFSCTSPVSSLLLLKFLKSSHGLSEINNNTQGAVRSRLYFRNLANIDFPYSGDQNHLISEKLLIGFEKLFVKRKKIENLLHKLKQVILAKAFRGELVPQDPNDEPAEKLLIRIKEEKKKLKSEGKKSKIKVPIKKTKNGKLKKQKAALV